MARLLVRRGKDPKLRRGVAAADDPLLVGLACVCWWCSGPKRYHMFKQAIGSKQTKLGFHGMIALTIFAR